MSKLSANPKEIPTIQANLDEGIWQIANLAKIGERAAMEADLDKSELVFQFEIIRQLADRLHDQSQRLT